MTFAVISLAEVAAEVATHLKTRNIEVVVVGRQRDHGARSRLNRWVRMTSVLIATITLTSSLLLSIFFVDSFGQRAGGTMMRTKIKRWGHSLALRIPKPFAIEARLDEKTEVDLTVKNGNLVITPTTKPPQRLEDLLSRVTKHNLHGQIDMGAPVGREAW